MNDFETWNGLRWRRITSIIQNIFLSLAAVGFGLFLLSPITGCSTEEGGISPDTLTYATPGVLSASLADTHSGWAMTNCSTSDCHGGIAHASGLADAECSECHGPNGAPERPPGECPDTDCTACHDEHSIRDFVAPNDCRACHRYDVSGFDENDSATCTHTEAYDVVIIGGGGGGLGAAAILARAGMNIAVIEQNYRVGGCMGGFIRGDYHFEISQHAVDGMGITMLTNPDLGIGDQIQPVKAEPVMYRAVFPGFTFDVPSDPDEYKAKLMEEFPDQAEGIDSLIDEMKSYAYLQYTTETFPEVLAAHGVTDERLIALITQLGISFGTTPDQLPASLFMALWSGNHVGGYHYFVGGSQSIADALAGVIEEAGGTIKLNTRVTDIIIENGVATRVLTAGGGCYDADYVISNANAPDTFLTMVGSEHLPVEFVAEIESGTPGLSAFHVYLGVDYDYTGYFPDTHGMFVNESFDMYENYLAIVECDAEKSGFILGNYTEADPRNAPPGKNVISIASMLGYECFNEWEWDTSYEHYNEQKFEAVNTLIQRAEKILPGLSGHIEVVEVGTPVTIREYTSNPRGSIFGWGLAATDLMGAMSPENNKTPIPNLFIAGAWANGGGQWMSINSGMLAAQLVLGN